MVKDLMELLKSGYWVEFKSHPGGYYCVQLYRPKDGVRRSKAVVAKTVEGAMECALAVAK